MSADPSRWLSQSISLIRSEQGEPSTLPNSDRIHELAWNGFAAFVNSGGDPKTDGTKDQGGYSFISPVEVKFWMDFIKLT